jgi:hypothetical protein
VLKGSTSSIDSLSHEKTTVELLKQSNLSVHLFDHFEGRLTEGESDSFYIQREVEIAFNNDTSQIVWVPEDLNINSGEEQSYKTFLSNLESKRPEKEYDYCRGVKNNFNQVILDQVALLKDKMKQKKILEDINSYGPLKVFIDFQIDDDDFAKNLTNILVDHDISAYYTPSSEDPETDSEKFKERLKSIQQKKGIQRKTNKKPGIFLLNSPSAKIFYHSWKFLQVVQIYWVLVDFFMRI